MNNKIYYCYISSEGSSAVSCPVYECTGLWQGRAYIYYDDNHEIEAKEFAQTMRTLHITPILHHMEYIDPALDHILSETSLRNDFYYENCLVVAIFTKNETIIHNNAPLKQIYNDFRAEKCTSLAGKLKLFCFLDSKYVSLL